MQALPQRAASMMEDCENGCYTAEASFDTQAHLQSLLWINDAPHSQNSVLILPNHPHSPYPESPCLPCLPCIAMPKASESYRFPRLYPILTRQSLLAFCIHAINPSLTILCVLVSLLLDKHTCGNSPSPTWQHTLHPHPTWSLIEMHTLDQIHSKKMNRKRRMTNESLENMDAMGVAHHAVAHPSDRTRSQSDPSIRWILTCCIKPSARKLP